MDARVGLWRRLSAEELMLLNCGVGEDSWPLDCKEIQPVHSKGDRPWVFFGRNDAKAETPVLWPLDEKNWLIWKDSDAGHNKHPLPTTQEKTLHMDITRWSISRSDWLYSLQLQMEKLYTVSKNKTRSWLWLRSWTPYCQILTSMEESRENH